MVLNKYSIEGNITGEIELSDKLFNSEINDVLIYELIRAANSNQRQGTHSTKERAEVRGGGAKPWRQKGTGRARHGSRRSPIWRGGGTTFGPKPRTYQIKLPKRIRIEAFKSLFSLKTKENSLIIIEDFSLLNGKTKELVKIGKNLQVKKALLINESEDPLIKRAIRNISWFNYNNVKRLSSKDIFYSKSILITESALKFLNNKYS